ncbi:hypothetical protein C2845_PM04G26430 [Panicum miliaceum]|uniref:Uncharacterized protein n=1 Tax=Panicum miliaceum TaxID=4540 RepID=A0A3L6QNZ4_PANMI|nr:hypothetical protein C2845_PM04G26430 [Panicum miliaceum]
MFNPNHQNPQHLNGPRPGPGGSNPHGPRAPQAARLILTQLGPQQLRYMALRSDSSAPACLRPSPAAARAPASAAAWGASPASRSRAPAEGAFSRCARTAATVAAAHTRLMGAAISSETTVGGGRCYC